MGIRRHPDRRRRVIRKFKAARETKRSRRIESAELIRRKNSCDYTEAMEIGCLSQRRKRLLFVVCLGLAGCTSLPPSVRPAPRWRASFPPMSASSRNRNLRDAKPGAQEPKWPDSISKINFKLADFFPGRGRRATKCHSGWARMSSASFRVRERTKRSSWSRPITITSALTKKAISIRGRPIMLPG